MGTQQLFDAALTVPGMMNLWAYLDPGTGSMLFQVLVAGALSASFLVRSWARSLRLGLRMKTRQS